jgi:hypothetical protein
MKRVLVLVAAIGLILPAAAQAGTFGGVVVAKSPKRHAIVTASRGGVVRTVRAPRGKIGLGKIGLGTRVRVRAAKLPDGTFLASGITKIGLGKRARVRGSVVKRAGRTLYLSAGHSVFTLGLRGSAGSKLRAGDRVAATASFGRATLFCDDVTPIGHADQIELEGIYLSTDDDVLSLAVHGRGLVKVTVPDGFDLPELTAGDELWLLATVEADGTFTLDAIDDEDTHDGDTGDDDGVDMGDNWFSVTGVISSLSDGKVAVDVERHDEPVVCETGSNDLSGFAAGQFVQMSCKLVDGTAVLVSLESKTAELPGDGDGSLDVKGFITALDPYKVSVSMPASTFSTASTQHDNPQSVTCKLKPGEDTRGFAVGDFVEIGCRYSSTLGAYALTSLSSDHATIQLDEDGLKQWFELSGVLATLAPGYLGVQVAHHDQPVQCAVPAGMDLRGFAPGDAVDVACENDGGGFVVKSISSDGADWPEDGQPELTLDGVLKSIRVDGVGVAVTHYPTLVNCAMPPGTNLSGFAIGDTVEMHCHFHDGAWHLAKLASEHSQLTLEE